MADTPASITYEKGKLYDINLTDLQADPNQPRKFMDPQALDDLTASITQHGVLTPILFRIGRLTPDASPLTPDASSPLTPDASPLTSLYIVAGERRVTAARAAGLTTIPGILVSANYSEIALVENLLRQDLTPVEEAEALDRLVKEQNYSQEQLGVIIGKARTTVSEILSLNRLPQAVRDECRGDASITRKTLIAIARKKQARAMTTAYNAYKAKLAKSKTARTKKDPTDPQPLLDLMGKTMEKISEVNSASWTPDQIDRFMTALNNLQDAILAAQAPLLR